MILTKKIKWLGHAAFRIDCEKTIYIDPYKIDEGKKADIIFVTHKHHDHCSKDDILKIIKPDTVIVTEKDSAKILNLDNMVVVKPEDKFTINGIQITVVPAYNINKPHHPQENGWLGFVIRTADLTVYHSGDTDAIPQMKGIKCDVALIPVFPGDMYVMNPQEAALATHYLNARVVVPMHYGTVGGSVEDALLMKSKANPKSIVTIMQPQKNS